MSPLLVLPAPLPSTSITLGQLITDPVYADSASLRLSQPPTHTTSNVQPKYQDTITHDEYGRFTSTCFISKLAGQAHYSHENLLLLDAEEMSHTTIDRPASAFNELRRDSTTRTFLRKMAQDNTVLSQKFVRVSTVHTTTTRTPQSCVFFNTTLLHQNEVF
jgi:hypothetical protein